MTDHKYEGFSQEERAALKEYAAERKSSASRGKKTLSREEAEAEVLAKISQFPDGDRELAGRVHAVIMAAGPSLMPRLWYGSPAYSIDGKVICFFQQASKFKTRYANLGFSDAAKLDDGSMWATSFAVPELSKDSESRITALVKKAIGG